MQDLGKVNIIAFASIHSESRFFNVHRLFILINDFKEDNFSSKRCLLLVPVIVNNNISKFVLIIKRMSVPIWWLDEHLDLTFVYNSLGTKCFSTNFDAPVLLLTVQCLNPSYFLDNLVFKVPWLNTILSDNFLGLHTAFLGFKNELNSLFVKDDALVVYV